MMTKRFLSIVSALIQVLHISGTDGAAIVTSVLGRCGESTLRETEPYLSGTLAYSSIGKYFCRWRVQDLRDPQEAVLLYVKTISFPGCGALLQLPGVHTTCVRKKPYCHSFTSDNSVCDSKEIRKHAIAAYKDCDQMRIPIHRGRSSLNIDFSPATPAWDSFELEFMKISCNENQTTTMPSSDTTLRNNSATTPPPVSTPQLAALLKYPSAPPNLGYLEAYTSNAQNRARNVNVKQKSLKTTPAPHSGQDLGVAAGTKKAVDRSATTITLSSETTDKDPTLSRQEESKGVIAGLISISIAFAALTSSLCILVWRQKNAIARANATSTEGSKDGVGWTTTGNDADALPA